MILLNIETQGSVPAYRQIFDQIKALIDEGALKPGDRLPATRVLASKLSLHRSTVYRAYEELWAMGYIQSRPGSYSTVRQRPKTAAAETRESCPIAWGEVSSASSRRVYDLFQDYRELDSRTQEMVNMARFSLDTRLFPADSFRKCLNAALFRYGPGLLNYGDPQGFAPLRAVIAQRMRIYGISASEEEILITNGSQNAFELIVRLLVSEKPVVLESPTYSLILPVLSAFEAPCLPVPMTDEGMNLDRLQEILKTTPVSFIYTMPNFQNPTGITTNQSHRERLLSICEAFGVPLVEDAFEEEMKYFGRVSLPIKSMDRHRVILYLGSFSKVLFPGIRIGWIAADSECIQRLLSIKRFSDLSSNNMIQAGLAEFCNRGHFEHHIQKIHRIYRKRMQTALRSLETWMPRSLVGWTAPSGGYLIWVRFLYPPRLNMPLDEHLLNHGVRVSMGSRHFPQAEKSESGFRISISSLNEEEIETGIRRLGEALNETTRMG